MKSSGFTLIEFLIYIGITVVILTILGESLWYLVLTETKEASWLEVQQNARFALTKINQEIRKAVKINSPDPGQSSTTLSLATSNTSTNPILIKVVNHKLTITIGKSQPQEITSDLIKLTNTQFTNLSEPATPGTIRIESSFNHLNPENRTEYKASLNISSTVSLRQQHPAIGCTGEPLSCDQFVDQSTCQSQDGCSWSAAYCGGTCTPCNQLARTQCIQQEGCRWIRLFCLGTCTSCDTYSNETDCNNQLGCSWNPAVCQGTAQACDTYTTQQDCESQAGCQWLIP